MLWDAVFSVRVADNGPSGAGVGKQNSTLMSVNGNAISWATNWTWANAPNNVKTCGYFVT